MPSHDSRKNMLATDALASVDGFRIMVHLTCSHLLGMSLFVKTVLIAIAQLSNVKACLVGMLKQKVAYWVE